VHWAAITIIDGRILDGSLPPRALRMVCEWRQAHETELVEVWSPVEPGLARRRQARGVKSPLSGD